MPVLFNIVDDFRAGCQPPDPPNRTTSGFSPFPYAQLRHSAPTLSCGRKKLSVHSQVVTLRVTTRGGGFQHPLFQGSSEDLWRLSLYVVPLPSHHPPMPRVPQTNLPPAINLAHNSKPFNSPDSEPPPCCTWLGLGGRCGDGDWLGGRDWDGDWNWRVLWSARSTKIINV